MLRRVHGTDQYKYVCDEPDCDAELPIEPASRQSDPLGFAIRGYREQQLAVNGWAVVGTIKGGKHYCDECKNILGNVELRELYDDTEDNRLAY